MEQTRRSGCGNSVKVVFPVADLPEMKIES
jgi:hypothetical protein